MRKAKLTLWSFVFIFQLIIQEASAQSIEWRANINSGLFFFRGSSAKAITEYNQTYTNSPFGSKGGVSWGASLSLRRCSRSGFLLGTDLGYEMLRSKTFINVVWLGDMGVQVDGRMHLNNSFINVFPYAGKRFDLGGQHLDLIAGADVGYLLNSTEDVHILDYSEAKWPRNDRKSIDIDVRLRIQASTDFDRVGIYTGYAYGLVNYKKNYDGGQPEAYSNMWRIGLTYLLNK